MRSRNLNLAILCSALTLAFLDFASADLDKNHLILGYRQHGDKMLIDKHVMVDWRLFSNVETTLTFVGSHRTNITQIQALDQSDNGKGASATVVAGGVGHHFVTIDFRSRWNRGIHFVVKIYGFGDANLYY